MINYNDVYLYQQFLDIIKYKTKIGDIIWYTIVQYSTSKPHLSYTINDEFKERINAKREEHLIQENRSSAFNPSTILIFDKMIVDKNTLAYIKNKYGHDETGECKRKKLYGY